MSEIPQVERLLKLLLNFSSGVRYTAEELTNRFAISRRTFHRDKRTLENLGFLINCENGRYWIEKNSSPLKQLNDLPYFSEEEAWILQQAIHSIDQNNQLKMNLVEKLYALYKFGKVAKVIVRKEQSENISNLTKAINLRQEVVLCNYRSANSNTVSNRTVEPFDFTPNYISVWAFDTNSRTNKIFKTSRIGKVKPTGKPQQFTQMHKSLPLDIFRISGEQQVDVKLRLSLRACNLLREEYPLSEKYLTEINENSWLLEAPISGYEGVGRFVLGLCDEIKVISPESFKSYLKEKTEKVRTFLDE